MLENQRLDFIKSSLDEKNIVYEERSLLASQGGFGKSIHVIFPSTNTNTGEMQEEFVLAVPLSTLNDNNGIARFDILMALYTAERLNNNLPPIPVRIAFLGDEYSCLPEDVSSMRNIGLSDLFSIYDTPENVIVSYFDLPFAPDKLNVHHGSDGTIAPLGILKPLTDSFEEQSILYNLTIKYNELYKLDLIKNQAALGKIQSSGFSGLFIEGNVTSSSSVSAELCGESIVGYIHNINVSAENYDNHYFFISAFNKTIYFSETFTVLTFLIIGIISLTLFLIYSLTHRHILLVQWKVFLKRSWIILLHFLILTGSLIFSSFIYFAIQRIFKTPNLPIDTLNPDYINILMRIFIALCFYNLCVPIFYRIWIPRKDRFYGNSAVVFVVIGTIAAVFMDITFVPIFLWSFIFTLLGTVLTNPWIVLLCTIAIPLQISGAFANIMYSKSPAFAELIASNNIYAALFIACIVLPEILMVNRVILLFRQNPKKPNIKKRIMLQLSIIVLGIIVLAVFEISSVQKIPLPPSRIYTTQLLDSQQQVLDVELTSTKYLDRRILSLSINALGNPEKFNISIINANKDSQTVIYNSPIPFDYLDEDNTLQFRLAERPNNPFTMELVLPAELQCIFLTEAVYSSWDINVDPNTPANTEDYLAVYSLSIPVP